MTLPRRCDRKPRDHPHLVTDEGRRPAATAQAPSRPGAGPARSAATGDSVGGQMARSAVNAIPTAVETDRPVLPTRPAGSDHADPTAVDQYAQTLWDALILVRATSPVISSAEDAVFRFYLPLAHDLARRTTTVDEVLADRVEQAVELGLANAVLAWRHPDSQGFRAFARTAVTAQIRRTQDPRRLGLWPPVSPESPHHAGPDVTTTPVPRLRARPDPA